MNVRLVVEMWTQRTNTEDSVCKVRAAKVISADSVDDELFAMRSALEMILHSSYNLKIYVTHTDQELD